VEKVGRGAGRLGARPKLYFKTRWGRAYLGDALKVLKGVPDGSVNLIVTSPPYALRAKKEYGSVDAENYVDWFMPFAKEFHRVLAEDGSFVLNIGGCWENGKPLRSLYHFELLLELCKTFELAEEFVWIKPAALPSPAEWVNVRRIRVKDAFEYVWWLSKTPYPKANNRNVLQPYTDAMKHLLKNGYRQKKRPSGYQISRWFHEDNGGSIPPNFLVFGSQESNSHYIRMCDKHGLKVHPARYPFKLPDFFIRFLTDANDLVLDPFAGSNVTGEAAEKNGRRWLACEMVQDYLDASKFRFDPTQKSLDPPELSAGNQVLARWVKPRVARQGNFGTNLQFIDETIKPVPQSQARQPLDLGGVRD
jgi:DNA modification methylase